VKILRIWLLVLLAILLPLRGAIAAALPCEGIDHPAPAEHAHLHAQTHMHMHMHMHMQHSMDAAGAEGGSSAAIDPGSHHHDQAGAHKCTPCSSCCSSAPLLLAFSPVVAALDGSSIDFALLQAPAPTFLSDGQERPPRSI